LCSCRGRIRRAIRARGGAGTDARPAGILRGLTTLGATAGATNDALRADLAKLANTVMPVGGEDIVFVASPQTALRIRLNVGSAFTYPIISSAQVPAGTVVAIALPALVSATDSTPRIRVEQDAVLHLEDSSASVAQIGVTGTMTSPVRSTFQTDSIAIRLILTVAWGLRDQNGVAFISSVTW
jgi:hypothetical protein